MKISSTYKFFALILSLSIILGVSIPTGFHHNMSEEMCDEMMEMNHAQQPISAHSEDCPMESESPKAHETEKKAHTLGLECACSLEEATLKIEAQKQIKIKVPVLFVVQILNEVHEQQDEIIIISDSYSPPPIYLSNESFLI